jgi:hypothetical protein
VRRSIKSISDSLSISMAQKNMSALDGRQEYTREKIHGFLYISVITTVARQEGSKSPFFRIRLFIRKLLEDHKTPADVIF